MRTAAGGAAGVPGASTGAADCAAALDDGLAPPLDEAPLAAQPASAAAARQAKAPAS